MKKIIAPVAAGIICVAGIVMGIISGFALDDLQLSTLFALLIICGASALYCFVVGEITGNTSQMDKLWSITPIIYVWVIAAYGSMAPRLVLFAVIVTLWGIRLTYNFAKKGAYSIKFWEGKEDYRWAILRTKPVLSNRFVWALFDLFFISVYQNALVLATTLPALAVMSSPNPIGIFDITAAAFALLFLILETLADENQWKFQETKRKMLAEGKTLSELPAPYNKGFNTTGIWGRCRHPNYLGEQGIWFSLYFVCIDAGVASFGIFNWSIIGSMLLILLFMGSSTLGERISSKKYPEYEAYRNTVFKYLPVKKYKN